MSLFAAPQPAATHVGGHPLHELMDEWVALGWVRPVDAVFARFLWREAPDAPALLILAALLASHQLSHGHACLDIEAALADPQGTLALPPDGAAPAPLEAAGRGPARVLAGVSAAQWLAALQHPGLVSGGPGDTPLVLVLPAVASAAGQDVPRLYLRRCWQYEQDINAALRLRLGEAERHGPDPDTLRPTLDALFPRRTQASASVSGTQPDWQKIACATAARSPLAIITGGPGTGKTTTVVRLLALLQADALAQDPARPLRIRLAAPTGKAAARLSESIAGAVQSLDLAGITAGEAVRAAVPTQVSTLHRLLGSRPGTRRFRHHAGQRLALDVLVVDEASMIDLETMAALLDALPPGARLVLLGDKDQLASVEAGAVLADLCARAGQGHYRPSTRDWVLRATGETLPPERLDAAGGELDQCVVMLRHSHRFAAGSAIGKLATAVNAGDRAAAAQVWEQAQAAGDGSVLKLTGASCMREFRAVVLHGGPQATRGGAAGAAMQDAAAAVSGGYAAYLDLLRATRPAIGANADQWDEWARAVLRAHGKFQVLTTLRAGEWGVEGLNRRITALLRAEGMLDGTDHWYAGRPVLVTRNDYALGLMNGDIGMTLDLPGTTPGTRTLRVAFLASDGSGRIKWILPSRLQAVETVFALTVHKSQGSEFDHAVLVLPEAPSAILTRELLYTGITRARSRLTLLSPGGDDVLDQGIVRRTHRASGLLVSVTGGDAPAG